MKTIRMFALAAIAILVSACCACRRSGNTVPLVGTEWKLSQLDGEAVVSDNYRMTLSDDGRIAGVGDCNRFTGTFALTSGAGRTNGGLTVGENLVSTRKMCPNQGREDAFLKMLSAVDSFSIDGTRLMLIDSGNVIAIFDRIIPASAQ